MRIVREVGYGAALQALREPEAGQERADARPAGADRGLCGWAGARSGGRAATAGPGGGAGAGRGAVAKFWRLPRVEHAGRIGAFEPEVADDPERPCREVEASGQRRLQGPALRGNADPASRLLVSALPA